MLEKIAKIAERVINFASVKYQTPSRWKLVKPVSTAFCFMETIILIGIFGMTITLDGLALLYFLGAFNDQIERFTQLRSREYRNKRLADRRDRQLFKEIQATANYLQKRVVENLTYQGFCYVAAVEGIRRKVSKIKLGDVLLTHEAIYYQIRRTPFRIQFTDLLKDEVATNLSIGIGRECKFLYDTPDAGLWLQIELSTGIAKVPKWFDWHSENDPYCAIKLLPKTELWRVAIGIGENRKFVYEDPRQWPHLLVAGMTKGGKSVFLRQLLATMISRLSPECLQLVLIDLKGGLEFGREFENIPHLRWPVIFETDGVTTVLQSIIAEKEKRWRMLRDDGCNSIDVWNSKHRSSPLRLPYIWVVFDEIAAMMLSSNKKLKAEASRFIENLAAQGRALGIHLVLCTQIPSKDVLSTIIRGNITARVCFAMDHVGSLLTLGNHSANEIHPGGRLIYQFGGNQVVLQGPYISDKQLSTVLDAVKNPETEEPLHEKLFRFSLTELDGFFGYKQVMLSGSTEHHTRRIAQEWEYKPESQEPIITLDQKRYILAPAFKLSRRTVPRMLIEVNGPLPTANEINLVCREEYKRRNTQGATGMAMEDIDA